MELSLEENFQHNDADLCPTVQMLTYLRLEAAEKTAWARYIKLRKANLQTRSINCCSFSKMDYCGKKGPLKTGAGRIGNIPDRRRTSAMALTSGGCGDRSFNRYFRLMAVATTPSFTFTLIRWTPALMRMGILLELSLPNSSLVIYHHSQPDVAALRSLDLWSWNCLLHAVQHVSVAT
ncbi:uncharacterized protein LOC144612002 [Rhinoraja longicauda]